MMPCVQVMSMVEAGCFIAGQDFFELIYKFVMWVTLREMTSVRNEEGKKRNGLLRVCKRSYFAHPCLIFLDHIYVVSVNEPRVRVRHDHKPRSGVLHSC